MVALSKIAIINVQIQCSTIKSPSIGEARNPRDEGNRSMAMVLVAVKMKEGLYLKGMIVCHQELVKYRNMNLLFYRVICKS